MSYFDVSFFFGTPSIRDRGISGNRVGGLLCRLARVPNVSFVLAVWIVAFGAFGFTGQEEKKTVFGRDLFSINNHHRRPFSVVGGPT
jgi:hypothetical protein